MMLRTKNGTFGLCPKIRIESFRFSKSGKIPQLKKYKAGSQNE
jgi:hypothetical protein